VAQQILKNNQYSDDNISIKNIRLTSSILFLAVPMVLSAFTHLWNPIGFPSLFVDEGIYMGRAMHVLEGRGPQESSIFFPSIYDHPYFGQLFLAGALSIIGYPDSFNLSPPPVDDYYYLLRSIEMLWLVPRVLMGLLAVVDTFLIYKIAERRYNRTVALIASILFAVMPLSWITRMVLLDSILLPFLLSSILFAIYLKDSKYHDNSKKKIAIVLLSGVFIGLAIFTKIPAFTMIPLVGFLMYTNNNKDLKIVGLWFVPVILIPLAWPAYAISVGKFDDWLDDVFWQTTERADISLFDALSRTFFYFDAVLLILAMGGFIYAAIKKDYFLLLWVIPFLTFLAIIGFVLPRMLIPLIPVFCIAAARLIGDLSNRINRKKVQLLLPFAIISAIGIFGLVSTTILITTYNNSSQFEKAAYVIQYSLQANNSNNNNNATNNTKLAEEIILDPSYSWIFRYIFDLKYYISIHNGDLSIQIKQ
jgi:hypothetical protein